MVKDTSNPQTMEELLASQSTKSKTFEQGQEVEGKILSISATEVVIDFGSKSEGVLSIRELPEDKRESLKVGDSLKSFISELENSEGQSVLSLTRSSGRQRSDSRGGFRGGANWQKFITARTARTVFSGKCTEVNKGGLVIEVDGIRGFLPSSQLGFDGLNILKSNPSPSGSDFRVIVSEVDQQNNKLIFTQKGLNSSSQEQNQKFSVKQKLTGKVAAVFSFGLIVTIDGGVGFISPQDTSWERVENLESQFKVAQEIDVVISNIDTDLGRVNLSLKNIEDDPIAKFAEKVKDQGAIKGTITEVGPTGLTVKLEEGVSGFIPSSKIDSSGLEVGQSLSVVIDAIDTSRRRISLAPFITTTKGLIYK